MRIERQIGRLARGLAEAGCGRTEARRRRREAIDERRRSCWGPLWRPLSAVPPPFRGSGRRRPIGHMPWLAAAVLGERRECARAISVRGFVRRWFGGAVVIGALTIAAPARAVTSVAVVHNVP
jgi:hypothetical protein